MMKTAGKIPDEADTMPPDVRTDLPRTAAIEISGSLRLLLADVFTLYLKTKNFQWHITGNCFHDHYRLLGEQADQLLAMTDDIAERARKIGGSTIRSISDISRHQRLKDNNDERLTPDEMLLELRDENVHLTRFLRATYGVCERHKDIATASLIENWVNETEGRTWFLSEIVSTDNAI
jgi:starvation-inducible DNA-binding protein